MNRSVDTLVSLLRGASRNALLAALLAFGLLLVLPLPTPLLSLLLVLDLALSALVLATLVKAGSSNRVSTLPTLLLLGALFRLSLNIASSRLILTNGDAGVVVESVGRLLTGGHWAVGLLLYAMVSLVQWMVINQGSARVAEVAARFALDAMPVRMLALDHEAKSGRLDGAELDRRRSALLEDANWQGAMDGAIRFVRGDALVGLLIALINLVAGTMLGILRDGASFATAIDTYTTLAIGDGLVSQIPSLLLSIGAAIAVTRVGGSEGGLGLSARMLDEFAGAPKQVLIAGLWVALFGLVPGLPAWPFFAVGGAAGLVGFAGMRGGWGAGVQSPLESAVVHLPASAFAKWQAEGHGASGLARQVEQRWGVRPPSLQIAPATAGDPDATLSWRGAQLARWSPDADAPPHLAFGVVQHAGELCARALDESQLKAHVHASAGALPAAAPLPLALEALRLCLSEGVAVLHAGRVFGHWAAAGSGPFTARQLAERAREVLLTERVVALSKEGRLATILVTPSVEQELRASIKLGSVTQDGEVPAAIRDAIEEALSVLIAGDAAAFVVNQEVRWLFARIAQRRFPQIPVFGHREVRYAGIELTIVARVTTR